MGLRKKRKTSSALSKGWDVREPRGLLREEELLGMSEKGLAGGNRDLSGESKQRELLWGDAQLGQTHALSQQLRQA